MGHSNCNWTPYSVLKRSFSLKCPHNKVVIAVTSRFDKASKDRRYLEPCFQCCMYRLFDFPFILFAYSATSHKLRSDGNHEATIFQRLEDRPVCPGLNKRTEFTDFCDDKLNKFAKMTMNRRKIWP